ncbi:DUF1643 domain-containing protein [Arcanobacterium buesumense]|uniref:DUF1643 domain-containing protein n=1 Tax=Arcanobacterium buesumense TaxID=2722751 RepID=A0A6H2EKG2_9ACTO|nr:DUF1643 domain-containing protein [Arcanobacterium buesumense]QJC21493.1 DUF1643 domain-containing protein [Arcanobacterium buesumense]
MTQELVIDEAALLDKLESQPVHYSSHPSGADLEFRWFLKRDFSAICDEQSGKNYLFIGMNPSTASEFSKTLTPKTPGGPHGDNTTQTILQKIEEGVFEYPARSVTMLNLIPLVCTKSSDVPGQWSLLSDSAKGTTLRATLTLVEQCATTADFIIPMWGQHKKSGNTWKQEPIRKISELLLRSDLQLAEKVYAFYNRDALLQNRVPYHCSYSWWTKENVEYGQFAGALRYLENI